MGRCDPYELVRSKKRKKTITLTVKKDGGVVIHAPHRLPASEIEGFFEKKRPWVEKKRAEAKKGEKAPIKHRQFVDGEPFYYLGDCYPLGIRDTDGSREALSLSHGMFLLNRNSRDGARHCFVRWYQRKAREVLTRRVGYWSEHLHLVATGITITGALHRYGSCSARNRLSFTWRIMMAPLDVIDYVIVHELAHIKEKNHSKRFWGLLEMILPDYKQRKLWLRENHHLLDV